MATTGETHAEAPLPGVGEVRRVHPVAALFPMMGDDELDDLAADIAANGLVHPIVVDGDGVLIDGRNRLEACRRAGVEPEYMTYDGNDPVAFILSENVRRRHLSKGQQAMAVALAAGFSKTTLRQLESETGVDHSRIAYARVVLQHAPELADGVMAGLSLNDAYKTATDRKRAIDGMQARLAQLRAEAPDLADLVVEERMSLPEALAALRERQEEARRYRELVTRQLDSALSSLDPRQMEFSGFIAQMAANVDPVALTIRPDFSPGRIRTCAAVLVALADALETKEV